MSREKKQKPNTTSNTDDVEAVRKKKKRKVFLNRQRRHLSYLMIAIVISSAFMVGRFAYIMLKHGEEYSAEALTQRNYTSQIIPYRRGDIRDCNGTVLATSDKIYSLVLSPHSIIGDPDSESDQAKRKKTIAALKEQFRLSDTEIEEGLKNDASKYYVVRKGLSYDEVRPFMDLMDKDGDIIGVSFEESYERVYPYNELACHVLGYVVAGNVGQGGLEDSYNEELNGIDGRSYAFLDDGNHLQHATENPRNGYNLVTTIDIEVQRIIQENALTLQKDMNPKNISVLVMKPKTCEILGLYNLHQFDPNDAYNINAIRYQYPDVADADYEQFVKNMSEEDYLDSLNQVWRNFVLSDTFEPGSTFKTFTLAGALDDNILAGDESFYCDGHQKVADWDIYCSEHDGHGMVDLPTAFAYSCNDTFMQIGAMMGRTVFAKYQSIFGFGRRTGIDILGEMSNESLSNLIYSEDRLNEVELATSAFGQSVSVTMIQLATAFCSVINGGYYYQPHIVKRIEDENGNVIKSYGNTLIRRTISEETSNKMRGILQSVVEHGTGWRTAMEGYTIGGKTGTAEKLKLENGVLKRADGKFILSFIGFAPVEDPEVMIYCVVDEPDVPQQDMSGAGTELFHRISKELFPYLNIYRTNDIDPESIEKVDDPVGEIIADGPVEDMDDEDSDDGEQAGEDDEKPADEGDGTEPENDGSEDSDSGGDGGEDPADDPGGGGDESGGDDSGGEDSDGGGAGGDDAGE